MYPLNQPLGVWSVSKWSKAKWTTDDMCEQITSELDKLKKRPNNKKEALIAEIAIKHGFTLVTDDHNLTTVGDKDGEKCISYKGFIGAILNKSH